MTGVKSWCDWCLAGRWAVQAVEPFSLGAYRSSEAAMTAAEAHQQLIRDRCARARERVPNAGDVSVAELLLPHAADFNADLVVMGGCGHPPANGFVFGGVTRTMFTSMTVLVLMPHSARPGRPPRAEMVFRPPIALGRVVAAAVAATSRAPAAAPSGNAMPHGSRPSP